MQFLVTFCVKKAKTPPENKFPYLKWVDYSLWLEAFCSLSHVVSVLAETVRQVVIFAKKMLVLFSSVRYCYDTLQPSSF